MVLINREELLNAFGLSEKTRKYGGDHSGYDTRMLYEIQDTIEDAETVKAIPEEWINDHVAWLESMDADVAWSDARAIKAMLTKWKMEQENAGGCSADACPIKF